ncbi:FRIGIDA-like protein 1 [Zea mays]|uniref:FRIGIDA-like protein n=1 Tax=Zea mays TaxID=4577 RepID=A0A317YF51_MAIZE|nr:FRIGIDA-like protein 1 [Zea mays]
MATQDELQAAVAAVTEKKRRLREAFDRLVSCAPVPVPFRWEDVDAHLAAIFRHLGSTHADVIAIAGGPATAAHHFQFQHTVKEEQDQERRVGRGASEEGQGSNAEEGRSASSHQERGEEEGEVREASVARPDREADEAGNILGAEAVPEQLDDEKEDDMGTIVASPHQRNDGIEMVVEEEEEAVKGNADREGREDEAEEGEWRQQHPHAAGGGETSSALAKAVAAACANMDPSALVDSLRVSGRSSPRAFLPALLGAPDPHALLVRAVGGVLDMASAERDASKWWCANCVALVECAPRLPAPSPDALAHAKRLAGRWKEMVVAGPAGGGDTGGMAGWGLLTFIASYDIAPEFDADEVIRLFGDIASELFRVMESSSELFVALHYSVDHFIENGQPIDAIRLARTFGLTGKYTPLAIMNDYIENAKKDAEDILSKESYTPESRKQAMAKKVDALIFSWSAIDGYDMDSVQRSRIKAEITQLLHKYANKQQSLAGVPASISSSHQQQKFQEEYRQRPPVEQETQQRKAHELQQETEEKQHHQQRKAQETQHQHIQDQQETQKREMWQNRKRRRQNKNRKRKQRRQNLQQQSKRPRLPPYVRPGVGNQHGQPFSGGRFAACATTIPPYYWSMG